MAIFSYTTSTEKSASGTTNYGRYYNVDTLNGGANTKIPPYSKINSVVAKFTAKRSGVNLSTSNGDARIYFYNEVSATKGVEVGYWENKVGTSYKEFSADITKYCRTETVDAGIIVKSLINNYPKLYFSSTSVVIRTHTIGSLGVYWDFTPPTFIISLSAGAGGTVSGAGTYDVGSTATIKATPSTGYRFVKWSDGNTNAERQITITTSDISANVTNRSYTAVFEKITFTATFKNHDGTVLQTVNVEHGGTPKYTGSTPTKPSTAEYSYSFSGWNPSIGAITSNITYTAQFTATKRKYTINTSATNGVVSGGGTYEYGTSITLTASPADGYKFEKWSDGNTQNPRGITVTGNATYTAQFTENKYTIAFNGNGNTGGSMSSLTNVGYDDSKTLTANAFTKTGYTFNGWNTKADGSGTSYADKATVSKLTDKNGATVTLYAKWKANSYTIKFNANGGSGSMSDLAMTYGTAKNLTAIGFTRTGYDFLGWSKSSTATTATYADKASVNNLATSGTVTLYAIWKVKTYIITVKSNNDSYGTVSGDGTYNHGSTATLIAAPKEGYEFIKWSDGVTSASRTVIVTENVTYTAVFEKITATIWYPISNYGTAILYNKNGEDVSEQLKFNYGEELTLVFVPKEEYKFVNFTFDGQNNSLSIPLGDIYENPITFSVIGSGTINISIVCQSKETYGVTLENIIIYKQDGNIVNEEGVTYSQYFEGTVLELKPDLSEPMHQFVRWGGDISGTEIPKTYTVTKDSYLRAILKEVQMKFKSVKILHHSTNEVASPTNPLIGGEDGDQAIIKVEIALE